MTSAEQEMVFAFALQAQADSPPPPLRPEQRELLQRVLNVPTRREQVRRAA